MLRLLGHFFKFCWLSLKNQQIFFRNPTAEMLEHIYIKFVCNFEYDRPNSFREICTKKLLFFSKKSYLPIFFFFQLTDLDKINNRHSTRYVEQFYEILNHFVQNCRRYRNKRKRRRAQGAENGLPPPPPPRKKLYPLEKKMLTVFFYWLT